MLGGVRCGVSASLCIESRRVARCDSSATLRQIASTVRPTWLDMARHGAQRRSISRCPAVRLSFVILTKLSRYQ